MPSLTALDLDVQHKQDFLELQKKTICMSYIPYLWFASLGVSKHF